MTTNCKLSSARRRGISLIELLVASAIGVVSFTGTMGLYSSLDKRNKSTDLDRSLASVSQAFRDAFAKDMSSTWTDLVNSGCSGSGVVMDFPVASAGQFNITLMDATQINLMTTTTRGRHGHRAPSEFRAAIDALRATYGTSADEKCSDPAVTSLQAYQAIGSSPYNQAICRCAVTHTFYGTLNPAAASVGASKGLYACALIEAKDVDASSQTAVVLNSNSIIAEGTVSFFGMTDNLPRTCAQLVANPADKVFGRFTYNLALKDNSVLARSFRNFGTLITD